MQLNKPKWVGQVELSYLTGTYLVVIEKRDTLNFGYPGVICALPPMSIAAFNVTAVFQVYKQDCSIMGIHFESNFPVYAFALLWFCSAHGTIWPLVAWDRDVKSQIFKNILEYRSSFEISFCNLFIPQNILKNGLFLHINLVSSIVDKQSHWNFGWPKYEQTLL